MSITIRDVADQAGVSTATVSHVLNDTRFVKEETRRRVFEAVDALGYIPNVNASGLRSSRTKRIGFLVPEIGSFFSIDILGAVERVLRHHGYQVIIGCTHEDLTIEQEQIDNFNFQQIDGLLMFPAPGDHSFLDRMPRQYPMVFIDRAALNCERDLFIGENYEATYNITRQMIREGHRHIGIITGDNGISALEERVQGYRSAFRDAGIEPVPELERNGESSCEGGFRETEWLLKDGRATAIIALTSSMTLGCMKCLGKRRIAIPQRMAVVCFGEADWCEIASPPLTTLRHPLFDMGRMAAEKLVERIDEKAENEPPRPCRTVRLPIELIRRQTF